MAKATQSRYYNLNKTFKVDGDYIYSIDAKNNLLAWIDFDTSPKDRGPKGLAVSYTNSPGTFEMNIGEGGAYNTVAILESATQFVSISDPGGILALTDAADSGTGSTSLDRKWSIAAWVSLADITTNKWIFARAGSGTSGFSIYADTSGYIYLMLATDSSNFIRAKTSAAVASNIVSPAGAYMVCTYDGSGTYAGFKLYLSAVEVALADNSTGTYAGLNPSYSNDFRIGSGGTSALKFGGAVSELAIWHHVITLNEIKAVQYGTGNRVFNLASGPLNNPPRTTIRELDNTLGEYPTINRTGDHDFKGNTSIRQFDDTWATIFSKPGGTKQRVLYPSIVPIGNPFVSGSRAHTIHGGGILDSFISSPNLSSSIIISRELNTYAGTETFGTSEIYSSIRNGNSGTLGYRGGVETISPYVDSRINLNASGSAVIHPSGLRAWYMSGTRTDVIPGFEANILDKTQVQIDIGTSQKCPVYFSTGSSEPGMSKHTGVAYFNWGNKKWEAHGDMSTTSNFDKFDSDSGIRHTGTDGISGGMSVFATSDGNLSDWRDRPSDAAALWPFIGTPQSSFGFPFAPKWDASGSNTTDTQLLDMSNYISHPFLIEKIQIDFSASFGPMFLSAYTQGPVTTGFFLMVQHQNTSGSSFLPDVTVQATTNDATSSLMPSPDGNVTGRATIVHPTGQLKDVIGWSAIRHKRNYTTTTLSGELERVCNSNKDLVIEHPRYDGSWTDASYFSGPVTGSYSVGFTPRIRGTDAGTGICTFFEYDRADPGSVGTMEFELTTNAFGNRNGLGRAGVLSCGRNFVKGMVGSTPTGKTTSDLSVNVGGAGISVVTGAIAESPYLIFPGDKLILGYEHPSNLYQNTMQGIKNVDGGTQIRGERAVALSRTEFLEGEAKLTLYGSLLRENLPAEHTLNTPLTSDAIHEAIHDGEIFDQQQVEYFASYRNSYLDKIFTGDMLRGTREVAGQCSLGTQGTTGSLLRAVKIATDNERYYDSLMPSISSYFSKRAISGSIFSADGVSTAPSAPGFKKLGVGISGYYFSGALSHGSDDLHDAWKSDKSLPWPYDGDPTRVFSEKQTIVLSASSDDTEITAITNYNDVKKALFTYGASNLVTIDRIRSDDIRYSGLSTRVKDQKFPFGAMGMRYGIVSTNPLYSEAVFRYDRFGQLRDMLEQRHDTRFFDMSERDDTTVLPGPVEIIFVNREDETPVDPYQTVSQNLSKYSTSSIPYIDGVAVDRVDNPDNQTSIVITELDVI